MLASRTGGTFAQLNPQLLPQQNQLKQQRPQILFSGDDGNTNPSGGSENSAPAAKPGILQKLAMSALSAVYSLSPENTRQILESKFIFLPQPAGTLTEDLAAYEVNFKSAGKTDAKSDVTTTINGVYVPAKAGKPTIVFSSGNAASMANSATIAKVAGWQEQGYGFLFYDYPGYGKSEGEPGEQNLYAAAQGAVDFLIDNNVPTSNQVLIGWSLGSAVTAEIASKNKVKGVILTSPFKNISAMVQSLREKSGVPDWWFPIPKGKNQPFDNYAKVKEIDAPLLILHGEDDEIIDMEQGKALFEAATVDPKSMVIYPGIHHNDIVGYSEYLKDVNAFLEMID